MLVEIRIRRWKHGVQAMCFVFVLGFHLLCDPFCFAKKLSHDVNTSSRRIGAVFGRDADIK